MRRPALPDKLYFRIGEVSALVGVAPHVLRYWEAEFPGVKPDKSPSGQRVYARRDVLRLLEIHRLVRELGYTFDGARRTLQLADAGIAPDAVPAPDAPPAARDAPTAPVAPGTPVLPAPVPPEAPAAPGMASGEAEALHRVVALRAGLLRARMGLSRALQAVAPEAEAGPPTRAGERSSEG